MQPTYEKGNIMTATCKVEDRTIDPRLLKEAKKPLPEAKLELGKVYFEQKEDKKAEHWLLKVLGYSESLCIPAANYYLGLIYAGKKGKAKKAIEYLERIPQTDENYQAAQEAIGDIYAEDVYKWRNDIKAIGHYVAAVKTGSTSVIEKLKFLQDEINDKYDFDKIYKIYRYCYDKGFISVQDYHDFLSEVKKQALSDGLKEKVYFQLATMKLLIDRPDKEAFFKLIDEIKEDANLRHGNKAKKINEFYTRERDKLIREQRWENIPGFWEHVKDTASKGRYDFLGKSEVNWFGIGLASVGIVIGNVLDHALLILPKLIDDPDGEINSAKQYFCEEGFGFLLGAAFGYVGHYLATAIQGLISPLTYPLTALYKYATGYKNKITEETIQTKVTKDALKQDPQVTRQGKPKTYGYGAITSILSHDKPVTPQGTTGYDPSEKARPLKPTSPRSYNFWVNRIVPEEKSSDHVSTAENSAGSSFA